MPWIKAKNGNVVEVEDPDLGTRALADGHEVFSSDPRAGRAKKWDPEAGDDSADES